MKTYTLQQDNGGSNPYPLTSKNVTVKIEEQKLSHHLRRHFRWHKDLTYDRLLKEGSHEWDRFIFYLKNQGF